MWFEYICILEDARFESQTSTTASVVTEVQLQWQSLLLHLLYLQGFRRNSDWAQRQLYCFGHLEEYNMATAESASAERLRAEENTPLIAVTEIDDCPPASKWSREQILTLASLSLINFTTVFRLQLLLHSFPCRRRIRDSQAQRLARVGFSLVKFLISPLYRRFVSIVEFWVILH